MNDSTSNSTVSGSSRNLQFLSLENFEILAKACWEIIEQINQETNVETNVETKFVFEDVFSPEESSIQEIVTYIFHLNCKCTINFYFVVIDIIETVDNIF